MATLLLASSGSRWIGLLPVGVIGVVTLGLIAFAVRSRIERYRFRIRREANAVAHGLRRAQVSSSRCDAFYGAFGSTLFWLSDEYRTEDRGEELFTRLGALFSIPLPKGLSVSRHGEEAVAVGARGLRQVRSNSPTVDPRLLVFGSDEAAVLALLGNAPATAAIAQFVLRDGFAVVTDSWATTRRKGELTIATVWSELLPVVVDAVNRIEAALAESPAAAAAAQLAPEPPPWGRTEPVDVGVAEAPAQAVEGTGQASAADRYVAQLAAEGVIDSDGTFTLDRAAAFTKLQEHRFREPEEFVLSLVRCAVARGATAIKVDVDTDDLRVTFDGRGFALSDYEQLYPSAFGAAPDGDARARRQLALAVSAALGLEPKFVRVTSHDGTNGVRLECRPGAPDELGACPPEEADVARTSIHVKARWRDLLEGRRARLESMLRLRAESCPVPLTLNGQDVARGLAFQHAHGLASAKGRGFRAAAGFRPGDQAGALVHWIMDGVWIGSHSFPDGPRDLIAFVDGSTRLDTDLSESKVVRNDKLDDALAVVRACVVPACEALAREQPDCADCGMTRDRARALLRSVTRSHVRTISYPPDGPAARLARLPSFQAIDLSELSIGRMLDTVRRRGYVPYADCTLAALAVPDDAVLPEDLRAADVVWLPWTIDARDRAFLYRLFRERLRSLGRELRALPRDPALMTAMLGTFDP